MLRRLLHIAGLAFVGVLTTAGTASATTFSTDCAHLQTTLTGATGAGDTVILNGICTGQSFTLPTTTNNLTIEGAATGNGFDGLGTTTAPALSSNSGANGLTLRNLVFENYASEAVHVNTFTAANPFTVDGVTFTNNHATAAFTGGGLLLNVNSSSACPAAGLSITVNNSTFTNNTSPGASGGGFGGEGGGGGAHISDQCLTGTGAGSPLVNITNDIFTGNVTNSPSSGQPRQGGGLWVAAAGSPSAKPIVLTQSNNLFSGNSVAGSGQDFAGGGEFTEGANMTSTNDRFIGNSLPSPTISTTHSEGGGLSTRNGGTCTTPGATTSTLINAVSAGNTIGAPTGMAEAGEGAGVYAGCTVGTGNYNLMLINSTLSGNQAPGDGGVGGVDGEPTDTLNLQNTIVEGNTGTGFGGFGASPGANVTAQNSDVCAIGGGSPFGGAGNICESPALVNAPAGDVRETPASPTIDTGSNAFVTTPTDVFGAPRIAEGKPGDAAIVDIGAAELPSDAFTIGKVKGKTLYVDVTSPGSVTVSQAGAGSAAVIAKKKKGKLLKPSSASGGPGTVAVHLLLTKGAKKQLKAKGKVKVKAVVTFSPTGGIRNTKHANLKLKKKKKK